MTLSNHKFFEMVLLDSPKMESSDLPLLRMVLQIACFKLAIEPACHLVNLSHIHLGGRVVLGT